MSVSYTSQILSRSSRVFDGEKNGTPMRSKTFQGAVFDDAAAKVGLHGLTPHSLRHTAASLAIAAGADLKVIQQILGHKSATMTLDLYGHLLPDRLDTVAGALSTTRTADLKTSEKLRRNTNPGTDQHPRFEPSMQIGP